MPVRMLKTDFSAEWKDTLQAQENNVEIKPILEWHKSSAPKPK